MRAKTLILYYEVTLWKILHVFHIEKFVFSIYKEKSFSVLCEFFCLLRSDNEHWGSCSGQCLFELYSVRSGASFYFFFTNQELFQNHLKKISYRVICFTGTPLLVLGRGVPVKKSPCSANQLNMQDSLRFQVMAWLWWSCCTEDAEFHILGRNKLRTITSMT